MLQVYCGAQTGKGFNYAGRTAAYAWMQAVGIDNGPILLRFSVPR